MAFAVNTHELLVRLFSSFESPPVRILTTDGEFHSFSRQSRRWQEAGLAQIDTVPVEPFETFEERLLETATGRSHELVYLSQVFFNSGYAARGLDELAAALSPDTCLVIDGYHGFMAIPTNLAALGRRAFYLAGGYKYAMSGEGVCFLHCPPGFAHRPVNTGWYAAFGDLEERVRHQEVPYARDGMRFFGATFDPSGLYRFVAVMDRWLELGLSVEAIHDHVVSLQRRFLVAVEAGQAGPLRASELVPGLGVAPLDAPRGHFLTFERTDAAALHRALRDLDVVTDYREDRLRFGFGIYQSADDVDALLDRLRQL